MNRYILIRRLTGPSVLLLLGVVALLHQADLVSWSLFVPLLLILIGLLKLAERAALAAADDVPAYPGPYPGAGFPYAAQPQPGAQQAPAQAAPAAAAQPEPAEAAPPEPDRDSEGGMQ